MRNFIVRVYRIYPEAEGLVAGIVEEIESGQKEAFRSFDDLRLFPVSTYWMFE